LCGAVARQDGGRALEPCCRKSESGSVRRPTTAFACSSPTRRETHKAWTATSRRSSRKTTTRTCDAQARGDTRTAAEWAKKRDDLLAELQRRAGGSGGLPAKLLEALEQLSIACARAGFGDADRDPGAEEALATLDQSPAPLPDFVAYLRQLAAGQLPPLPASLPAELRQILEPLAHAIREARS
jgi:hypothetical protein